MKKSVIILLGLILVSCTLVESQNNMNADPKAKKVQTFSIQSDTVFNVALDKDDKIIIPENQTLYCIASYKNIDFLKANPFQLEAAGFHPEIYISNTHRGVIIISSAESNDAMKNFRNTLESNPNYYETLTRQDTIVFSPANIHVPALDFTKASSISHDYKNAFNYAVDPRTGISWSKGTHKDFLQDDVLGKTVYDLIIVISRPTVK